VITFSVKSDLEATISQFARVMDKQMPFAVSKALNATAVAAKEEILRQLPSLTDRPNTATMRGWWHEYAKKERLTTTVQFRPGGGRNKNPRDWLHALVYGGPRKLAGFERALAGTGLLPSGYVARPGNAAELDAHGNMSRQQLSSIISYFKGSGRLGTQSMTDKQRAVMNRDNKRSAKLGISYVLSANGRGVPGIWRKTTAGSGESMLEPIMIFVAKPSYRAQLDVPGIAQRVIKERFAEELSKSVAEAKRTAIPKTQMKLI
jgi:hypothetical protein